MPSRLSYVWLSLKRGLGSRTAAEVLDAFGSPEAVFAADRQALHAMILGFIHPVTEEYMEFEAPIPEYFSKLLDKLRK